VEVPLRRAESHFQVPGGSTLFRRGWVPQDAQRLVVLVHGYAEHSGRYEHVGRWLASRGCAVHAYDQRGHGRADGPRGHVRRFGDFLDDLAFFLDLCRREHPDLPAFVTGHSMGGLVVAAFACERAPELSGAALSGAALELGQVPSAPERIALRLLRRLAPRLPMKRPIAPELLSRDEAVGRAYLADPLVFRRMTLSLASELLETAGRTLRGAGRVRFPMLVLHGEDDRLCRASGSRRFFEALSAPGSDLRIYPGLRHEIFNEPEREVVFADLLEWLRKRERG
jgi:alpha-beta hydrolase superfamily lysophospholipase